MRRNTDKKCGKRNCERLKALRRNEVGKSLNSLSEFMFLTYFKSLCCRWGGYTAVSDLGGPDSIMGMVSVGVKVMLGYAFPEYINFPCQLFHKCLLYPCINGSNAWHFSERCHKVGRGSRLLPSTWLGPE